MRIASALFALLSAFLPAFGADEAPRPLKLIAAHGSIRSDEATLVWDRPEWAVKGLKYVVTQDGVKIAETDRCHLTARDLKPEHGYVFEVKADGSPTIWTSLRLRTKAKETIVNVTAHGALGDGKTLDTQAIQAAIDACPPGGVVLIPEGTFLSGALRLKSDLTLEIAKGGVLKGSKNPKDYLPLVRNRFEGWEMETYASLLNAGKMDHAGTASVRNLSIRGEGRLSGGGAELAKAMIAERGMRGRGRLICLLNAADVEIAGLTLDSSPCWTLHYIYSERITCRGLTIQSRVRNGDGLDPDSSSDSLIFGCSFDTGDDCIAVKSGKNPEGNRIARPTERTRIFDCNFLRGHGISLGSEMSGGIRGVLVEDCVAGKLLHGFQIKAIPARGGFIEDVTVRSCDLQKISILSDLNYNRDGEAAPTKPVFRNYRFRDIDLTKADVSKPVIILNGFAGTDNRLRDVRLEDIRLPAGASVKIEDAEDIVFTCVAGPDGKPPVFQEKNVDKVVR
ncbi:MAG: glycosyl hydrolase family 28 protein [Opitutales bacterium]